MEPIILASSSLRRQEYFKLLGLPFITLPAMLDETLPPNTSPEKHTSDLAIKKVKNALEVLKGRLPRWICGADTVVALDNEIFGKPRDRESAKETLQKLSGRGHKVITSMAIYGGPDREIDCRTASCKVNFAQLSAAEIEWYLDTNEWQGVAGAYRIQGLAACIIESIEGSPSAVVGLPLRDFYVMLRDNGYPYGA